GLPLGIFLAWLVTKALSGQGVSFAIPGQLLVYFVWVAVSAGLLAAIAAPRLAAESARRAAVRVISRRPADHSSGQAPQGPVPAFGAAVNRLITRRDR